MIMKTIKLNNGIEMPQQGLGTFLIPKENLSDTIGEAYRLGYRQFDTAWRYHNEREIAEALKANGINRKDVFITTKVNADALYRFGYYYGKHSILNIRNFKSIHAAIMESFENLETDYIDLFLVHWPWPMYRKMYKELTKLYHEGRIRAIGVSSFTPAHIESLKEISDVVPAVNQIEISPLNTQKATIQYCQQHGIAVEAMSTFSHFRSNKPRMEIINHPVLMQIAATHNKTVAQIVLRWLLQQDILLIPKTWDFTHLKENIDILDFVLTDEEIATIDSLDQGVCLNYNPNLPHITRSIPKKYRNIVG
jgi:diketogulonate reductase-like aldo/keto reductase